MLMRIWSKYIVSNNNDGTFDNGGGGGCRRCLGRSRVAGSGDETDWSLKKSHALF